MANNNCKYYKQVRQVSYDGGQTWTNMGETQKGDLYEYESMECGGGVTQYRWVDIPGGKGRVIEYDSVDCGGGGGDYQNQYLTFVAIEDGRFKFSGNSVQYTMDEGNTWTTLASDTYTPTVYAGQKIMWRGNLTSILGGIGKFSSTGKFNVEGNAMSLLFGDNFAGQTSLAGKGAAFYGLFRACTGVISAENLVLPATTLTEDCYSDMFVNCSSLTTVPSLPATTLAKWCYAYMFQNCTSLTTVPTDLLPATTLADRCYFGMFWNTRITSVPTLPATTLANYCYEHMFSGCVSLTTVPSDLLPATTLTAHCYRNMFGGCSNLTAAPDLPAAILKEHCYDDMFIDCSRLNYIKCLATDISATDCTETWVSDVASSGTFVKNSSMNDWTRGQSGIPTNWTVQNA